ncbi:hypothetical protein GKZ90_0012505 [Flavobacterium sp. MC2016-06]|jgi:hypothetical protein|uniref:hypothetical protein n=1 Tax=Flavobacterium sp. MC2016-06 TaxID=2676308 RepID=UPI0012BABF8E|nr:hypothetical protein [Flavobacterium sp. MC2016-06]MBU3860131.1 hypothetical protein [Flavobacterium sp. MC2016-06]
MTTDKNTLKNWFSTRKKPLQAQFWAWIDSYWHKDESIPQNAIENLTETLNTKTEKLQFDAHLIDSNAHIIEFETKEDKIQKGQADGYAPLNEFSKILTTYLNTVDDLITGGIDAVLTAEQGKKLQIQIDGINTILSSDDINLDTVQELVDAIKEIQTYLDTILINDLTTGGITKALTAEMGKSLKALIDGIYQPDTLISTTVPTRITNTFTYPAFGYTALINKVKYQNTAQFQTTITAAAADYKRTDLIYIGVNGVISKIQGTESLTATERPSIPANCVGISFVNVFGLTISEPSPITQNISIQDPFGIEMFSISDYIKFENVSFNSSKKLISIDSLVPLSAFLDTTNGNDTTAIIENSKKPFKTMSALVNALPTTIGETYTIYINGSTVSVTRRMPGRNLRFVAFTPTTLDFTLCKENDGVTETTDVISSYLSGATWTFDNNNISLISNYVGTKRFQFGGTAPVLKGNINIFNFKSGDTYGAIRLYEGSDIIINNLYDSPQNVPFLNNAVYNYNLKIRNFYCQYGRSIQNKSNITIDNIIKVGTSTFSLRISDPTVQTTTTIGNVTLDGCNLYPQSNITNFAGLISATTAVYFDGCKLISGNFNSTIYPINSWLNGTQTYRNYTGKLANVNIVDDGNIIFENCIIDTNTVLVEKRLDSVSGAIKSNIITTRGFNTINQLNNNSDIFYAKTGTSYDRTITVTDYGVIQTNSPSLGETVNQVNVNSSFKEKSKDRIVRSKKDLINKTLLSNVNYIVDGIITLLTGEYVTIPSGGLKLTGYGFDLSQINKNVTGESIFKGPLTGGTGNFVTKDIQYNSGLGRVFDLNDIDNSHVIEMNNINFENCSSLGKIKGYKQFTGTAIGVYGCSDGLTLSGAWNGFSVDKLHVRTFGATGTLFKKDTDTVFSNRFVAEVNQSGVIGGKFSDFDDTIFSKNELFQITNSVFEVAGVINESNTTALIPNISPNNSKSRWTNSLGIKLTAVPFTDLKSNNKTWRLAVDDSGVISATDIT